MNAYQTIDEEGRFVTVKAEDVLRPRFVQALVKSGVVGVAVLGGELPLPCILEDIDLSKILALKAENCPTAEDFQAVIDGMADLSIVKTGVGIPALTPDENPQTFFAVSRILSAENVRPVREFIEPKDGRLHFCLMETDGKETDLCAVDKEFDFSFRALFSPNEVRDFAVDLRTGKVTEPFGKAKFSL